VALRAALISLGAGALCALAIAGIAGPGARLRPQGALRSLGVLGLGGSL
jgi:hypothetical protein